MAREYRCSCAVCGELTSAKRRDAKFCRKSACRRKASEAKARGDEYVALGKPTEQTLRAVLAKHPQLLQRDLRAERPLRNLNAHRVRAVDRRVPLLIRDGRSIWLVGLKVGAATFAAIRQVQGDLQDCRFEATGVLVCRSFRDKHVRSCKRRGIVPLTYDPGWFRLPILVAKRSERITTGDTSEIARKRSHPDTNRDEILSTRRGILDSCTICEATGDAGGILYCASCRRLFCMACMTEDADGRWLCCLCSSGATTRRKARKLVPMEKAREMAMAKTVSDCAPGSLPHVPSTASQAPESGTQRSGVGGYQLGSIVTDATLAEAATRFLEVLVPLRDGEYIELRPMAAQGGYVQGRGWFRSAKELVEQAKKIAQSCHVFFGVCPRRREGGTEKDVSRLTSLWADVDAKKFEGGKAQALDALRKFPTSPSIIVDTGHGYHAYWLLEDPLEIRWDYNVATAKRRVKGLQRAIHPSLDPKHNLDAILRLPGTFNLKDAPLPVRIETFDLDKRYGLAQFDRYEAALDNSKPSVVHRIGVPNIDPQAALWKAVRNGLSPRMSRAIHEPDKVVGEYISHSELHCAVCYALAGCGLDDSEIFAIMTEYPISQHEKIRDRPHNYLLEITIPHARRYQEEHPYKSAKYIRRPPTPWDPRYADRIIEAAYPLGLTTRPLRGVSVGFVKMRARLNRDKKVARAYAVILETLLRAPALRQSLLAATQAASIKERTTDAALKAAERLGRVKPKKKGKQVVYSLAPSYARLLTLDND